MAPRSRETLKSISDEALIQRVQSILINVAEGRRSVGDDAQYDRLRRELIRRPLSTPQFITTHPNVDSFAAYIRGLSHRSERVRRVREQFEPLFAALDAKNDLTDSTLWTGRENRTAKLLAARKLLPLARAAIEGMIADLSEPGPNHGPLLDEHEEAIEHLRELHRTLGELLDAVEAGHLDDDLGQGLMAEGARYAKRAARAVSRDVMPYAASSMLLGILWTCGFPGIGGYLADVALTVRKAAQKPDR